MNAGYFRPAYSIAGEKRAFTIRVKKNLDLPLIQKKLAGMVNRAATGAIPYMKQFLLWTKK